MSLGGFLVWNRRWAVAACVLAVAGPVGAQQNSKPESAEAAAAMERAKRQAANPLRVILEASKPRRKGAEAEPAEAAAPRAAQPPQLAVAAPPVQPVLAKPVPEAAVPSRIVTEVTLNSAALQRKEAAAPVAALQAAGSATNMTPLPAAALAMPKLAAAPARPKLIAMVEPSVPPRVVDEIGGKLNEVEVDVTIRADGTVASATVLPPAPRQLHRYVVAAVEQWRFEPLPGERVHRVQLVFNNER
jgi:TonB family protein